VRQFKNLLILLGVKNLLNLSKYLFYIKEYIGFKKLLRKSTKRFEMRFSEGKACLDDRTNNTTFDRHYVFHTAWAARCVAKINPNKHVDISSSLYFCSIISAFVPVDFFDYRPAELNLTQLKSKKGDLLSLPLKNNSVQSLSCMHVVEHIGLGRYGDPFDPEGDIKAIFELQRVVEIGGSLLFVVPMGEKSKIMYNAHRIYNYDQVIGYFPKYELVEFSVIPEDSKGGGIINFASKNDLIGSEYACGCFWFKKQSQEEYYEM